MTVIDLHTHFIPPFVVDRAKANGVFGVREVGGWLVHPQGFRYPVTQEFIDPAAKLAEMDRLDIELSAMSIAPTLFFYEAPERDAVGFAEEANDALAEFIQGSDRLEALATLPLQAPPAAAAELRRAVLELGFLGAHIGTSYAGRPLDDPELAPVFATAEELDVPLMLHPYYVGPKAGLADFYFTNSIGNPLDTTIAAARLIHSGMLDRHSHLKVVLVHAGGFLPYQLGRLDHAFAVRSEPRVEISGPPSSYLRRFWFDTITHSDLALAFLVATAGVDRLVLGTDLPFDMAESEPLERLSRVGLEADQLGQTAASLLNLGDGGL